MSKFDMVLERDKLRQGLRDLIYDALGSGIEFEDIKDVVNEVLEESLE